MFSQERVILVPTKTHPPNRISRVSHVTVCQSVYKHENILTTTYTDHTKDKRVEEESRSSVFVVRMSNDSCGT